MKQNKWQIIIGWVVPILLILILLIFTIPFPINRTVSALEINMADSSVATEHTITVKGHYYINLFTSDIFSGSLTVSGYDYADGSYPMEDLRVTSDVHIDYVIDETNPDITQRRYAFGMLYSDAFFSDMMIAVFEHEGPSSVGFGTADATVIVANAADRESALKIAEDWFYPNE